MALLFIGAIAVAFIFYIISAYNSLVVLRNKVEEAFSTMDVYLKKRFDLVPNLASTVKGYAQHEAETLEKLTALRSQATTVNEQFDSEKKITSAIRGIMVAVEKYPELKANENFLELQKQLHDIEEDIATARRYYNGSVRQYNNSVQMFPSNIIAGMFHFDKKPMFEVNSVEEREAVNVSLEK